MPDYSYGSTSAKVLPYFRKGTPVLQAKYRSTPGEVLRYYFILFSDRSVAPVIVLFVAVELEFFRDTGCLQCLEHDALFFG